MRLIERPLESLLRLNLHPEDVVETANYRIAGIYSFGRGFINRPSINGAETSYPRLFKISEGQLVMSKLGAWEGAFAVVPREFDGAFVSPEYPTFDIDDSVADVRYIANLAMWPGFWERVNPRGSMARRKRITAAALMEILVPLPSLAEQRRIAARLDSTLEKQARVRELQNYGAKLRESLSASVFDTVENKEPLSGFLIPSSNFVEVDPLEEYRTCGIYSYGRGLFRRQPVLGAETNYRRYNRLRAGQFVYSKLFGWEGALATVTPSFDGTFVSHEFPTFDIDERVADFGYVSHLARWKNLHEQLRDKTTGMGSRRQRVNPERLLTARVPLPGLDEQRRIASILDRVAECGSRAGNQQADVDQLAGRLLHAGFNGEL